MPPFLRCSCLLLLALRFVSSTAPAEAAHKTEALFLVMTDGVRWEEVFRGAEPLLISKRPGGVKDPARLKAQFSRPAVGARREALMPFLWRTVARQGQLWGNKELGSIVRVSNGLNFSYPGYSETLCGFADPWADSNKKRPNPNQTVLEWLGRKPQFARKLAAFAAWDVFPYIFNRERCGFYINAGYEPFLEGEVTPQLELLNRLKSDVPRHWEGEPFDALTYYTAKEYLRLQEPSILYLSLGETDEWAHEGRYDEYLWSIRRFDQFLADLWDFLQSHPRYRNRTTLMITTDHGRGHGPEEWKSHGKKETGSEFIWFAVIGPDTPPAGERRETPTVTQSQFAATAARFLGQDYCAAVPRAGRPIAEVFSLELRPK